MPIVAGLAILLLVLALWMFFRPQQHAGPVVRPNPPRRAAPADPEDHEEFQRRFRARVEQQRRAARERRRTGDET